MNWQRSPLVLSVVAAVVLAGCGGGASGEAGTNAFAGGADATTTELSSAALIASVKSLELTSVDQDALTGDLVDSVENVDTEGKALVRVVAKNAQGETIVGVPVLFSSSGNATLSAGTWTSATDTTGETTANKKVLTRGTKTDASGVMVALIDSGNNYTNRIEQISAKVAGSSVASNTLDISFSGTRFEDPILSPSVVAAGSINNQVKYRLLNGKGVGVSGQSVSFSVNESVIQVQKTDTKGFATFLFDASAIQSQVKLTAEALGVTSSRQLDLVKAKVATAVVANFGSMSLSASSPIVNVNSSSNDDNRVDLRTEFKTNNSIPLDGVLVRFQIDPKTAYLGGSFMQGSNKLLTPVLTDATGVAAVSFLAGSVATSQSGLKLQACYFFKDEDASGPCKAGQINSIDLTVANKAVSISIAPADNLVRDGNMYKKTYDIQLTNAQGAVVSGARVVPSIVYNSFAKGALQWSKDASAWITVTQQWCAPKDVNGDYILQRSEDFDESGQVFPRYSDIAISPTTVLTNADGRATFTVTYPQSVAGWVMYDFNVSTLVAGTEGTAKYNDIATRLLDDVKKESSPAFIRSPYSSVLDEQTKDGVSYSSGVQVSAPRATKYPDFCSVIK